MRSSPLRRPVGTLVASVLLTFIGTSLYMVVGALPASASTDFTSFSPPLTGATDFATDFPNSGGSLGIGPIGMIDDGTNFFVSDLFNRQLYKFPTTGGDAATVLSAADGLFGLALSNGVYFGTNLAGGIDTFDPSTLAVTTTNATVPCSDEGMAADPLSTDLFVDTTCGVYRVQNPTSATPTVTLFSTTLPSDTFDGISISSDGQDIWAADTSARNAVEFDRTGAVIASVSDPSGLDGIGIAEPGVISGGINVSKNAFVNNNNGTITRVDTNNSDATSTVASGGTRGDMVITGPDGCLYATQSDRVEKLSPCFFQPTPLPTTLSTSLSGGGSSGPKISVFTNTLVTDAATVSGTNASSASGTVTYNVYSDSGCTALASAGTPKTITTPGTLPPSSAVSLSGIGTYYWQAVYSGGGSNQASTSTCGSEVETVLAPTAVGAFVIGDLSAGNPTVGNLVNFWGSQWAKDNAFSDGRAPASMKGFADDLTAFVCGSRWTTRPGNSSAPPATLPSTINVIVSSNVTKSGSVITGNILHIVVVMVSPGYGPDPGHAGTGKIVGTIC
jgi:hypothetical protein